MKKGTKIAGAAAVSALALATGAGCASTRTVPGPTVTVRVPVPGPVTTVTKTVKVPVPGPVTTVTKTVKVPVPGPVKTVTKTVTAPPPAPGEKVGSWSGTGNQNTPAFYTPQTGDYIVKWTYWNNSDPYGASNFSISPTDNSAFGGNMPNDIASSGSGSTEITGATGNTDSFNVQAVGSWTITVIAAS
jgi:hypothetical protein